MTIQEALTKRIPRIRKPIWANPASYLRLPLLVHNQCGPWAELYDEIVQKFLEIRPGSQRRFIGLVNDSQDWEEYTGAISEFEKHPDNYSKGYEER